MGSSSSKANASSESSSPSSSSVARRSRSRGSRVFQSSCLTGSHHCDNDDPNVSDHDAKEDGCEYSCMKEVKSGPSEVNTECYRKVQTEQLDDTTCVSSNVEHREWGQSNFSDTISRADGTSRGFSSRLLNPSARFLSRISFFPGNVSFRLSRATSLRSSRSYHESSRSLSISNDDEELNLHTVPGCGLVNRNDSSRGCDLLPACFVNRSPRREHGDFGPCNIHLNSAVSGSDNSRDDQITSTQVVATAVHNSILEFNVNVHSSRNHSEIESTETRFADRWIGAREPADQNAQFSRTLSVGRLRDRVHRSSFPEVTSSPLQQQDERRNASRCIRRQAPGSQTGPTVFDRNGFMSSPSSGFVPSSLAGSLCSGQDFEVETSRAREASYHDLFEHRSNFLERRRRIRSQVRALQRLGSSFENLSGRERSCLLSGQHRTNHCTCRSGTQRANPNDVTSARASISRIVMLAEALFEVLDEIQQQSVVLSSQPSVSSIGSVPAPNEVVDSLPVKLYVRLQKHLNDEAAQCYICLVEYEDGDCLRVLPCHHDFHRACIDKWLKEIHRVCPLCRGDICRLDLPTEN